MKIKYILAILGASFALSSCSSWLDEDVFSQLDPDMVFSSAEGIEKVLFNAYRETQFNGNFGGNIEFQEEWTCDQFWETGGAVNQQAVPMMGYTWNPSQPGHQNDLWNMCYNAIRNANLVLENIEASPVADNMKAVFTAEARFIRAIAYYKLVMRVGGVPLRVSSTGEREMARSTAEEIHAFIEQDLLAAVGPLPTDISEVSGYQYGRATKGAAYGFLTKLYLNTKQWQKCADAAQEVMNLNKYELWDDYTTLFSVENERVNKEFIWVFTCSPLDPGNELINGSFPTNYKSKVDGSHPFLPNMRNWARQDRIYDFFYNSFDPNDKRRETILTDFINTNGKVVSLLNNNNTRMFKYTPDPAANGNANGNDIPVIRFADILLSRAEALNELQGPTDEVISLINQVRSRANLTDLRRENYTKETLRSHILDERGWEFYGENLRRQDLIRHGELIKRAQNRPFNAPTAAEDHHILFPIPQQEIDANPLCTQNDGY